MATKMTLKEALKEALQDDNKVSKYEAKVIYDLIKVQGHFTENERKYLRDALQRDHFDPEAQRLLSELLLKADLKR